MVGNEWWNKTVHLPVARREGGKEGGRKEGRTIMKKVIDLGVGFCGKG
jgi:hypothetical protein